jgi:MFS family permease
MCRTIPWIEGAREVTYLKSSDSSGKRWFNRSTGGIALASLLSDVSHELGTAVLPSVLLAVGAGPAALGLVEGAADGISSLAKLGGGVMTDRVARRKPLASVGYLVTAVGMAGIGLCTNAWQVFVCRVAAWIGRGSRSAPRDYLMAEAVSAGERGRAFGMERAADALGAVIGPIIAIILLSRGVSPQGVMIGSIAPGILAFLAIALLVIERPTPVAQRSGSPVSSLAGIDASFRGYLAGVFLFGCGDFSRTLLILYASQHLSGSLLSLEGASLAIGLYVLHNAVSSAAAFPLGALADRIGRKPLVIAGYLFAAATTAGFALLPPAPLPLVILFVASGLYIACEEVAEKAYAVDLLSKERRGTGLGLLAACNGVGDMISSSLVGLLWASFPASPAVGFLAAASLQLAGGIVVGAARGRNDATES